MVRQRQSAAARDPRSRAWLPPWLLVAWAAGWAAAHLPAPAGSWHYFATGARALLAVSSPAGGLHLYHTHPELQIGPLSLLAAAPLTLLPTAAAKVTAALLMSVAGAAVLWGISRLVPAARRAMVLTSGAVLAPVWCDLAGRAGHLDDVLAMVFTVAALVALRVDRTTAAAVLLAAAADSKPWALPFAALLLTVPTSRRRRAAAWWAATVVAAWLPFLLADPGSLLAARYQIANAAGSALRALGVTDPVTPWWCRPAQILLGAAVGWLMWRRRRTAAIVFAVVAARLLLDPGTWSYYGASLLVGAVLIDVSRPGPRRPVPWFTLGGALTVWLPGYIHAGVWGSPDLHGGLRAAYLICAVTAAALLPLDALTRSPTSQADSPPSHAHRPRVER